MLGKLLKHETKYFAQRFIPFYIAYAISAILLRLSSIFVQSQDANSTSYVIANIFLVLVSILYGFGTAGLMLFAIFGNVSRFHKNLFTDEGYLMNTLPVPSYNHILCKLISGFIWYIISCGVVYGVMFIADSGSEDIFSLLLKQLTSMISESPLGTIAMLVCSALTYAAFLLLCYMCEGITSKSGGRKVLTAVILIGCIVVNAIISTVLTAIVLTNSDTGNISSNNMTMIVSKIIYYAIVCVGLFFITNNIIKNHLNLE